MPRRLDSSWPLLDMPSCRREWVLVRDLCSGAPTPKLVSCPKKVAVSKNLKVLAREVARVQGQPAGKEEDSDTSDENGPLLVPKSAGVVSGR